jgi:hypothetical protein
VVHLLSPVHQLEMRLEFLQGILEIGLLCNFDKKKLEEIQEIVLEELSYIDNLMYDVYEQTGESVIAFAVWNSSMEQLRRWLSLVTGIKIKYV